MKVHNYYIILAILMTMFCGCGEEVENYYPSLDVAKKENAIEKGLIPMVIPLSAKKIYERHFVDTDTVWVKFEMDRNEIPDFIKKLMPINSSNVESVLSEISATPQWWPEDLEKKSSKSINEEFKFLVARYDYSIDYNSAHKEYKYGYFFLNPVDGSAYYYGGINK